MIMKYASVKLFVLTISFLRANSVLQQGKPCSFLTAPCPGYRSDAQKYIRPGRERGNTGNTTRGARYTRYRLILGTANW